MIALTTVRCGCIAMRINDDDDHVGSDDDDSDVDDDDNRAKEIQSL